MVYIFGDYELDTARFELRRGGRGCKVEPQVFSLLELLIANHVRVVGKEEINRQVWGGRVVSEAVVNSRVRAARIAIGDDGKAQRLIRTVHRRGFRFVGEVRVNEDLPAPMLSQAALPPDPEAGASATDPWPARPGLDAAGAARPSIAVMPLQVLTPDSRYENLGDAVAQEVIVELSRLHWLFVISRGSSFRLRAPDPDAEAVGRVLGVRYVLTGTIACYRRMSIVAVELVDAGDGSVVWADRYEGSLDDLPHLRARISAAIVASLELRIPAAEAARSAGVPTEDLDAWSAYHRALAHMYRFNRHDNDIAAALFDRAIVADPGFARAYAGLSFTHFQRALLGYSTAPGRERDLARRSAEQAFALDSLDPLVNLTMGRSDWIRGALDESMSWLDRSIELSPNYAFALYNRGLLRALNGAGEPSERDTTSAMLLSPIDPLAYAFLGTRALSHLVRGDYASAALWSDRAARAPGAHVHLQVIAALAHELAGDAQRAAQFARLAAAMSPRVRGEDFLGVFRFRQDEMQRLARTALQRLGL